MGLLNLLKKIEITKGEKMEQTVVITKEVAKDCMMQLRNIVRPDEEEQPKLHAVILLLYAYVNGVIDSNGDSTYINPINNN